jgi:hypothetical protein
MLSWAEVVAPTQADESYEPWNFEILWFAGIIKKRKKKE